MFSDKLNIFIKALIAVTLLLCLSILACPSNDQGIFNDKCSTDIFISVVVLIIIIIILTLLYICIRKRELNEYTQLLE